MTTNTIFCADSGRVYTKSIDGPVISIGTFPTHDYAGDYVEPGRGDWSAYTIPYGQPGSVFGPVANWTHGCPIGRGKVEVKTLTHEGKSSPVEVMTTEFFQTAADVDGIDLRRRNPETNRSWDKQPPYTIDDVLRVAAQSEILVRDEVATGVSVEFDVEVTRKGTAPYEGDYWDLAQDSLLEGRKARHFYNWRGLGYAHARRPVNPGCLTLQQTPDAVGASIEKAIRVAQTGKLPNGEVACEIILKAFTDLKDYRSRGMILTTDTPPTTQPAQPSQTTQPSTPSNLPPASEGTAQQASQTPVVSAPNATPVAAVPPTPPQTSPVVATPSATAVILPSAPISGSPPVHVKGYYDNYTYSVPGILTETPSRGCRAFYNTAQSLLDIANCLEIDAGESDDLSVRKFAKKEATRLKEEAAVFKARAEKLRSKLEGKDEDDWDDEDAELSVEEKAITVADDGALVIKAFPDWKPRRMTIANLSPVETPTPVSPETPTVSPEEQVVLDAQYKVLVKALRQKARMAKELMEAAIANGRI